MVKNCRQRLQLHLSCNKVKHSRKADVPLSYMQGKEAMSFRTSSRQGKKVSSAEMAQTKLVFVRLDNLCRQHQFITPTCTPCS